MSLSGDNSPKGTLLNCRAYAAGTALYLAHLALCGLTGAVPDELGDVGSWKTVLSLAISNSIVGLTWHAVERLSSIPVDVRDRWMAAAQWVEAREMMLEAECALVCRELTDRGISVMPLKGAVISSLYPKIGMRSASDVDILYGRIICTEDGRWVNAGTTPGEQERIMKTTLQELFLVMDSLGYVAQGKEDIGSSHDVAFFKIPSLRLEMHHALFSDWQADRGPFHNSWEWAFPSENAKAQGRGLIMERDRETEYAHFILHSVRHLVFGGFGLRTLMDLVVLLGSWAAEMDWGKVESLLAPYDALKFESDFRELCNRFINGALSCKDESWIANMVAQGTYGLSVNKSYARQVRRLMGKLGVTDSMRLPGRPLKYIGEGVVARPLISLYKVLWNGVQSVRATGLVEKIK